MNAKVVSKKYLVKLIKYPYNQSKQKTSYYTKEIPTYLSHELYVTLYQEIKKLIWKMILESLQKRFIKLFIWQPSKLLINNIYFHFKYFWNKNGNIIHKILKLSSKQIVLLLRQNHTKKEDILYLIHKKDTNL